MLTDICYVGASAAVIYSISLVIVSAITYHIITFPPVIHT